MATPGREPGVEVTQEFITAAPILEDTPLPVVVVGICKQLERDATVSGYVGASGVTDEAYPNLKLNATVDTSSVDVRVQTSDGIFAFDAGVTPGANGFTVAAGSTITRTIYGAGTTGESAATAVFTDENAKFITWQVQAGDDFNITSGVDAGAHEVATVLSQTSVEFTLALTGTEENIQYNVTRTEVPDGTLLVDYDAVRSDLNDELVTVETSDEIEEQLGTISPDNPLAFGVYMASLNTDTTVSATGIDEDTSPEHTRALEFLESKEVYTIIPLTQEEDYFSLYEAHVDQTSDPEAKHERIVVINRELVVQEERIPESAGRTGWLFYDAGGGTPVWEWREDAGDFTSDGILPGDFVYFLDGATSVILLVQGVINATRLLINQPGSSYGGAALPAAGIGDVGNQKAYSVLSETKSKTEQAEYLAAYAQAFSNRRVVMFWPDQIEINYTGTPEFVPGYFGSAALGGQIAGELPQQPHTNLSLAGITALQHSNKYFSETQLRTMSAGGIFIVVQDVDGAPVRIRQQRTTDVSSILKNELSVVKITDYVSKILRQELQPYIGKYNITEQYLQTLRTVIAGLTERFKEPTRGDSPTIIDGQLISIAQSTTSLDTVEIVYRIEAPVPANFITITLQV